MVRCVTQGVLRYNRSQNIALRIQNWPRQDYEVDSRFWTEYLIVPSGEGNRIKRTAIATGEVTEYVWDHWNRLAAVVDRLSEEGPVVQSVEYVYDSQNRWIGKSVDPDGDGPEDAVETHFVYQGNQIILQVDGEGQVTNRYLWGPAVDQILADEQVEVDGSSEVLWTLTDHLNAVRDLAVHDPESGVTSVVNHVVYDAFGRVTSQSDPTVRGVPKRLEGGGGGGRSRCYNPIGGGALLLDGFRIWLRSMRDGRSIRDQFQYEDEETEWVLPG